jgi:hypothetical protein
MDTQGFNAMRSGFRGLSEFAQSQGQTGTDGLGEALAAISYGLASMEQTRRGGAFREDERSLGKLGYAIQNIGEATHRMSRNFLEGDVKASLGARRLMEMSERAYSFTSRLRARVRDTY